MIGLAQAVGTGELLSDDRHVRGVDRGERRALLAVASLALVGNIRDLFIRRQAETIWATPSGRNTQDPS